MAANKTFLYACVGVTAALLGILLASLVLAPRSVELKSGTLLAQPRPLPEFALVDHEGQAFTRAQLAGGWTVLFAGFTHCPDVCPTTLAMLKDLHARLEDVPPLRVVFLSVDPQRDTPDKLKAYVSHFSPQFVGVTAQEPQLQEFTRGLGLAYARVPGDTPDRYQMDHSAALVLIGPGAQVAGYFSPPFVPETLEHDLRAAMRARS